MVETVFAVMFVVIADVLLGTVITMPAANAQGRDMHRLRDRHQWQITIQA